MKMRTWVIIATLIFWPISLFLANTPKNFFIYTLPLIPILLSFYLYKKEASLYWLSLILIPFVSPKLALLPPLFFLVFYFLGKKPKLFLSFIVSLIILVSFFKPFWGQTIFKPDYEARQEVVRNTQLYPSIFLARTFQNKVRIYLNKFSDNFFALTDPNNYFFAFHPREIPVNNQNLLKYPFLALIFLIFGLVNLRGSKDFRFTGSIFLAAIFSLSVLVNFDRHDFILFIPISILIVWGINTFDRKLSKGKNWFYLLFIFFSLFELIRIVVSARL